jgi:hypothetical protein
MRSTILLKLEQKFISKLERETKSYKFEWGAKSYQNSNAKHNPIKIRSENHIKTWAGSKIVEIQAGNKIRSECECEAQSFKQSSRISYQNSSGKQNLINSSGEQNPIRIRMRSTIVLKFKQNFI